MGVADYKLLLHLNGTDGATATTDTSNSAHTINFAGTAQLDTAQKKFGTASLLLDGDSDDINIADSVDWDLLASSTDDWTVDLHVKHVDHVGVEIYIAQFESTTNFWQLAHEHVNEMRFKVASAVFTDWEMIGGEITDTNQHHVAMCKVGSDWGVYLDGTQVSYISKTTTDTFAGSLFIGQNGNAGQFYDGHCDEIRISHFNEFSAAPNVGKTDTITVPTAEYADPVPRNPVLQTIIIS